jgi:lysophospholipase L1-like esterase
VVLVLVSLAAAVAVGEIAVRVYARSIAPRRWVVEYSRSWDDIPDRFLRYVPHPYFSHMTNPAFRSEDGKDRHNRFGFRGRDFEAEKPEGTYRIFCVGGSTTYTTSVDNYADAFPAQLERVLRQTHGRTNIEVVNAGVPAFASLDSLINVLLRILPLDPDLIVVYHGINDVATRLVPPDTYRRDNRGYRRDWSLREREGPPRWWYHSRLAYWLAVKLGALPPQRVGYGFFPDTSRMSAADLDRNPPVHYATNLRQMALLAADAGASIMFSTWACSEDFTDPVLKAGVHQNNAVARRTGRQLGVPVFDFAANMPADPQFWEDSIHVNRRGAVRKAELFAAFIEQHFLNKQGE